MTLKILERRNAFQVKKREKKKHRGRNVGSVYLLFSAIRERVELLLFKQTKLKQRRGDKLGKNFTTPFSDCVALTQHVYLHINI